MLEIQGRLEAQGCWTRHRLLSAQHVFRQPDTQGRLPVLGTPQAGWPMVEAPPCTLQLLETKLSGRLQGAEQGLDTQAVC